MPRAGRWASAGRPRAIIPNFAAFLVEQGIDSLSLNADAFAKTRARVFAVESAMAVARAASG